MTRSLSAALGLLLIAFNLAAVAALAAALIWVAVQGHWLEIGWGLLAAIGGAAALTAGGLAADALAGLGVKAGPAGGAPRAVGQLTSLALTAVWAWGLFTYLPVSAIASPWPRLLFLYAIAVVAAFIAGLVQMGFAASSKPERTTLAAFNALACHGFALAIGGCALSGRGEMVLWVLGAVFVLAGIVKLLAARDIDAPAAPTV